MFLRAAAARVQHLSLRCMTEKSTGWRMILCSDDQKATGTTTTQQGRSMRTGE